MIKVGLTGGIGSGKSTVAGFFEDLGIAVYYADVHAKTLMLEDATLKKGILKLFGKEAYRDGKTLNREFIAGKVFGNPQNLKALNSLVHPVVSTHFDTWCLRQKSPYVIKEAAILFENGGYHKCDYTIVVIAPIEIRIKRVQQRDHTTREQIISRVRAQWGDYEKIARADCVITNLDLAKTSEEVSRIDVHLKRRIERGWI